MQMNTAKLNNRCHLLVICRAAISLNRRRRSTFLYHEKKNVKLTAEVCFHPVRLYQYYVVKPLLIQDFYGRLLDLWST